MAKCLIRLVKQSDNYKVIGTSLKVRARVMGDVFPARTVGDVEKAARKFPYIPSPNAYYIASRRIAFHVARVQLCLLSEGDYEQASEFLDKQRRMANLV